MSFFKEYFQSFSWEKDGEFYTKLGVRKARHFVAGGLFWQKLGLASKNKQWNKKNINGYIQQSIVAEVAHTLSLFFLFSMAIVLFAKKYPIDAAVLALGNIFLNLYPIFVARYNRLRILKRMSSIAGKPNKALKGTNT